MGKSRAPWRVFVVDDHPAILAAVDALLRRATGLRVCGTATEPKQALAGIVARRAQLAVVDLRLATGSGIELIQKLRARRLALPVLVYSGCVELPMIRAALAAGANGFMSKAEFSPMVPALQSLAEGGTYFSRAVATLLAPPAPSTVAASRSLSHRQRQIFRLIGEGRDIKDIAGLLGVKPSTAYTNCRRMCGKLRLHDFKSLQFAAMRAESPSLS